MREGGRELRARGVRCAGAGRRGDSHQEGAAASRSPTLARAFLHCRQALRVTDSGTLRRLEEEALAPERPPSPSLPRGRRGSDPVVDSDVLGVVVGVLLLSPNEGRILRNELFMLDTSD